MDLDIDYGAGCSNINAINDNNDQSDRIHYDSSDNENIQSTSNNEMDTTQCRNAKKRRISENDNEPSSKVFVKCSEIDENSKLLNLSDEVLLEIFKNCDSPSLIAVSKTCRRLSNLVWDRRLWRVFDFSLESLTAQKILHRLKYVNKETRTVRLKGLVSKYPQNKWRNVTVTFWMLTTLKDDCPDLETLEIYDGYLNFELMNITDFPSTLKKLTFSGCEANFPPPPKVFFNNIDFHLKNLEELSLERCPWFETHDLIIFSKLPRLKKLVLRGCASLSECVPYGSIAARFGFRSLQVFDIRDTPISDSDLQCFNITTTLRELLLECPEELRNINPTSSNYWSLFNQRVTSIRFRSNNALQANLNGLQSTDNNNAGPAAASAEVGSSNNGVVQPPAAMPNNERNDNCGENRIIHIVVQDRNYLNVNDNNRNENNREDEDAEEEVAHIAGQDLNNPREPVNIFRLAPPPEQQQQLIIVRGNGNNEGNRNRISWEIVNCNLQPPRYLQLQDPAQPTNCFGGGGGPRRLPLPFVQPPVTLISDRGIQCFGVAKNNVQDNIIWIRAEKRSPDTLIEKLVVRHYKLVTDISLRHLINCAPNLKYLDVTGTSVTLDGVTSFKAAKPQCTIISNFDI